MDARSIEELRALERRDAELSERAERLRGFEAEVAAIRACADAIDAFFAEYPVREEQTRAEGTGAAADLAARRAELAGAEQDLADEREDAERAVARAHDHVAVAEARLARARAAADALEEEASTLPAKLPSLAERARAVDANATAPEPAPRALIDWAVQAHASLFVALGQLDTQRERMIREANELATMLLGEPTYGSTVAQALARVEVTAAREA